MDYMPALRIIVFLADNVKKGEPLEEVRLFVTHITPSLSLNQRRVMEVAMVSELSLRHYGMLSRELLSRIAIVHSRPRAVISPN